MKKWTKILLAVAAAAGIGAGVSCLAKKHNDEDEYVVAEDETVEDSDLDEEAE
jgi:hypothetical protein